MANGGEGPHVEKGLDGRYRDLPDNNASPAQLDERFDVLSRQKVGGVDDPSHEAILKDVVDTARAIGRSLTPTPQSIQEYRK